MTTRAAAAIAFDNSYARLPGTMHVGVAPTAVEAPRLIKVNAALAAELGLDPALLTADVAVGNALLDGAAPLAQAYAGHQFGNFVPQLGDGRAILLGEVIDRHGRRRDIQLKGAGPTPFSRRGDGRAALGPVLREYLVSEAMHALGIPDDAGADGGHHRRKGLPRTGAARRGTDPRCGKPHPCRHIPVLRCPARSRLVEAPRRPCHRPALSGSSPMPPIPIWRCSMR